MEILNQGFDHVEYVVHDVRRLAQVFERMGFEKTGERYLPGQGEQGTRTLSYAQGWVRVLLTQADTGNGAAGTGAVGAAGTTGTTGAMGSSPQKGSHEAEPESLKFLRKHAEGICVLALEVKDATRAFEEAVKRGARPAKEPVAFKSPEGTVIRSEVWTPGDVRYAFMERHAPRGNQAPALFDEGLVVSRLESPSPFGIRQIDHLTNNVGMGQMKDWVKYYRDIFGFIVTRHFDIRTQRTGLISDVVESPDHRVKVPINEPTEPESQIQEFVDRMKGAGVQHLALLTTGLPDTLRKLKKQDFKFLTVPHTYYEVVPTRVPGVTEDLGEMEELGILLDGEGGGYLLQIFSEEILGPFFFEYIQRKGNEGFGEGNFRALFEAIERDQLRRGVLKSS